MLCFSVVAYCTRRGDPPGGGDRLIQNPMIVDSQSGLLADVRQVPSPNQDLRPGGTEPDLLVIHCISLPPGCFGGPHIEELFTNCLDPNGHPYFSEICGLEVSAHVLIRRDGELVQFVPFNRRAWHAGDSCHDGRRCCNDFSIGIELEGMDDGGFEPAQYRKLAELVTALVDAYPGLSRDRIVGHCDIAPGRKKDPGPGFDWLELRKLLAGM